MSGGSPFENPKNATYEYFYCSHAQETRPRGSGYDYKSRLKESSFVGNSWVSESECLFLPRLSQSPWLLLKNKAVYWYI